MNKCSKCGAPIFVDEPLPQPQWCLDCIIMDGTTAPPATTPARTAEQHADDAAALIAIVTEMAKVAPSHLRPLRLVAESMMRGPEKTCEHEHTAQLGPASFQCVDCGRISDRGGDWHFPNW